MDKNIFDDRRKALEDAFFTKRDQQLLATLKQQRQKQSLRESAGIDDDALLDRLVECGLGSEDMAALALVPLVEVAWADGKMDERERRAILAAAEASGMPKDGTPHRLLEDWLQAKPGDDLFQTWKDFVGAIVAQLDFASAAGLRRGVTERARTVAEAAGGILGAMALSNAERRVINEIDKAFE